MIYKRTEDRIFQTDVGLYKINDGTYSNDQKIK